MCWTVEQYLSYKSCIGVKGTCGSKVWVCNTTNCRSGFRQLQHL